MSGGIIVVDTETQKPNENRGLVLRTSPVASSTAQKEGILLDLEHRTSRESMPEHATTGWSVRAAGGFKSGRWPGITRIGSSYYYNNTTISLSSPPQLGAFQQNVFCPTPRGNHVFKIYDGGAVLYSVSTHGRRWTLLGYTLRSAYAFFCKEDKSLVLVVLYTTGKAEFITVDLVYGQDRHWVETGYGDYSLVCHLGSEVIFFANSKQRYVKVAGRFGCKAASEGVFEEKTLSISGNYTNALGGDECYAVQLSSGSFKLMNKTNVNSSSYSGIMFQFNGTICLIPSSAKFCWFKGLAQYTNGPTIQNAVYGVVNDMVLLWNGSIGAQQGIYYDAAEDTYKVQNDAWFVGDDTNMTCVNIPTILTQIPDNDMPLSWNVFMKNNSSTTIYQSSHPSPGETESPSTVTRIPSERLYYDIIYTAPSLTYSSGMTTGGQGVDLFINSTAVYRPALNGAIVTCSSSTTGKGSNVVHARFKGKDVFFKGTSVVGADTYLSPEANMLQSFVWGDRLYTRSSSALYGWEWIGGLKVDESGYWTPHTSGNLIKFQNTAFSAGNGYIEYMRDANTNNRVSTADSSLDKTMYGTIAWDSAVFIDGSNITRFTDLSTKTQTACTFSDTGLFIGTVKEEGMEVVVANNKEIRLVPVPVKGTGISAGTDQFDEVISYDGKIYFQGDKSIKTLDSAGTVSTVWTLTVDATEFNIINGYIVAVPGSSNKIYAKKIDTGTELTPLDFSHSDRSGFTKSTVIVDGNGVEHMIAPWNTPGIIDITISTVQGVDTIVATSIGSSNQSSHCITFGKYVVFGVTQINQTLTTVHYTGSTPVVGTLSAPHSYTTWCLLSGLAAGNYAAATNGTSMELWMAVDGVPVLIQTLSGVRTLPQREIFQHGDYVYESYGSIFRFIFPTPRYIKTLTYSVNMYSSVYNSLHVWYKGYLVVVKEGKIFVYTVNGDTLTQYTTINIAATSTLAVAQDYLWILWNHTYTHKRMYLFTLTDGVFTQVAALEQNTTQSKTLSLIAVGDKVYAIPNDYNSSGYDVHIWTFNGNTLNVETKQNIYTAYQPASIQGYLLIPYNGIKIYKPDLTLYKQVSVSQNVYYCAVVQDKYIFINNAVYEFDGNTLTKISTTGPDNVRMYSDGESVYTQGYENIIHRYQIKNGEVVSTEFKAQTNTLQYFMTRHGRYLFVQYLNSIDVYDVAPRLQYAGKWNGLSNGQYQSYIDAPWGTPYWFPDSTAYPLTYTPQLQTADLTTTGLSFSFTAQGRFHNVNNEAVFLNSTQARFYYLTDGKVQIAEQNIASSSSAVCRDANGNEDLVVKNENYLELWKRGQSEYTQRVSWEHDPITFKNWIWDQAYDTYIYHDGQLHPTKFNDGTSYLVQRYVELDNSLIRKEVGGIARSVYAPYLFCGYNASLSTTEIFAYNNALHCGGKRFDKDLTLLGDSSQAQVVFEWGGFYLVKGSGNFTWQPTNQSVPGTYAIKNWDNVVFYDGAEVSVYKLGPKLRRSRVFTLPTAPADPAGGAPQLITQNFILANNVVRGLAHEDKWERSGAQLSSYVHFLAACTLGDYALFGGGSGSSPSYKDTVGVFAVVDESVQRVQNLRLSTGRHYLAACTLGDYALFGGGSGSSPSYKDTVDVFTVEGGQVKRLQTLALSVPRDYLAACTLGDYALFGGGYNGNYKDTVDVFGIVGGQVQLVKTLHLSVPRYGLAACTLGDYALFGSGSGSSPSYKDTVDVFGIVSGEVQLVKTVQLSVPRYYLAACTLGDYALFGGGSGSSPSYKDTVDVFGIVSGEVQLVKTLALSIPRRALAACTLGDYALFGGGYNGNYKDTVDVFGIVSGEVQLVKTLALSVPRYGLAACTLGDYALFGGGYDGSYKDTVDVFTYARDLALYNTAPTNIIQNSSLAFNIVPGKISSLPGGYTAYTLALPSPFYSFGFKTLSGRILIVWAWEDKVNVYVYTSGGPEDLRCSASSLERINVNIIAHSGRKCVGVSGQYYTGVLVWASNTGTLLSIINDGGYEFYTREFTTGKTTAAQVYTNIYSWGNMSAIYTRHVYTGYSLCMKTWVKGMKMKKVNDARLERDASQTETLYPARQNLAACTISSGGVQYALFGGGYNDSNGIYNAVNVFSVNDGQVEFIKTLSISPGRWHLAACTLGEYALFGGGYNSGLKDNVDVFGIEGGQVKCVKTLTLSSPRRMLAACTISDGVKQYALFGGGEDSDGYTKDSVDVFGINAGGEVVYVKTLRLSPPRRALAACTISSEGVQYALFGGGESNISPYYQNAVDVFGIVEGQVEFIKTLALSIPRKELAACALGEYALFGGGYNSSSSNGGSIYQDTVDIFGIVGGQVEFIKTLSLFPPRRALAACTISDGVKQYALFGGGYNDTSSPWYKDTVDVFGIVDGKVQYVKTLALSIPRRALAACTISDGAKQYALFGGGDDGSQKNTIDVFKFTTGTTNSLNISSSSFKPALNFEMDGGSPPGVETVYENERVARLNHGMIQAVVGQKQVKYPPLTEAEAMEEADEDEKIDYMYVFKQ